MKRNSKIEFMRAFFCLMVILFHAGRKLNIQPIHIKNLEVTFLGYGYIGVEFFFLVSGFLLGKSVYKMRQQSLQSPDLGEETWSFWKRKFMSVFPHNVIAIVLVFGICAFEKNWHGVTLLKNLANVIPQLFFAQKLGFNFKSVNGITWYISAMLISMLILYPLCRKYYSMFVHVIGPLIGFYILGFIYFSTGSVSGVNSWLACDFKCVERAFAEISLGIVCFEIARQLNEKKKTKVQRMIATGIEVFGYLFVTMFALFTPPKKYEIFCICLLAICIVLTFSEYSYGLSLFDHKWIYQLGKLSLPLYLNQMFAIHVAKIFGGAYRIRIQLIILVLALIVSCVISELLIKMYKRFAPSY